MTKKTIKLTKRSTYLWLAVIVFSIGANLHSLFKFISTSICPKYIIRSASLWSIALIIFTGIIFIDARKRYFQEETAKQICLYMGIWLLIVGVEQFVLMLFKIGWLYILFYIMTIAFCIPVILSCINHLKYLKNRPPEELEKEKKEIKEMEEDIELNKQRDKAMVLTYIGAGTFLVIVGLFNLYRFEEFPNINFGAFGNLSKYIIANLISLIAILTILIKVKLKPVLRFFSPMILFGIVNIIFCPKALILKAPSEVFLLWIGLPWVLFGLLFWIFSSL